MQREVCSPLFPPFLLVLPLDTSTNFVDIGPVSKALHIVVAHQAHGTFFRYIEIKVYMSTCPSIYIRVFGSHCICLSVCIGMGSHHSRISLHAYLLPCIYPCTGMGSRQLAKHIARVDDYLWVAEDGMKMQVRSRRCTDLKDKYFTMHIDAHT